MSSSTLDWSCKHTWKRSAKNTIWCVIGCSIGDFGTILFFQLTKIPFPIIDIYFFNWNKLTETQIHDHANKGCCLLLLTGELEEKIYDVDINHIHTNKYIKNRTV